MTAESKLSQKQINIKFRFIGLFLLKIWKKSLKTRQIIKELEPKLSLWSIIVAEKYPMDQRCVVTPLVMCVYNSDVICKNFPFYPVSLNMIIILQKISSKKVKKTLSHMIAWSVPLLRNTHFSLPFVCYWYWYLGTGMSLEVMTFTF